MNRCFHIPELVVEISLQCDKHTLATLGRTARLFDCALDVLWSGCHDEARRISLHRIIQFFPCELDTTDCHTLSSAIEPQHWNRFNVYARRIKSFQLDTCKIDPAFLASLVGHKPPGNILPNLKDLWVRVEIEDELVHGHKFLSPSLQILNIDIYEESIEGSTLSSLLHTIPTISANISNLQLPKLRSVHFPILPSLFGRLRNLRQLVLHSISTEYLPSITSAPGLTRLSILRIEDCNVVSPSTSTFAFNTLSSLDLAGSPEEIRAVFRLLSKCPLECVSLRILQLRQASDFAEIVRTVTDKCLPHTLCRVRVSEFYGSPTEITGEQLAPFLAFPNMTYFDHLHYGPLQLDDSFISSLATSWPHLDHLYLSPGTYGPQPYTPSVTAKSFALLALHCPRLSFVGLAFDATTVTSVLSKDVGDRPENGQGSFAIREACNKSVRILSVGYSPIAEPARVAEFMCSIFPNLTRLNFYTPSFIGPAAGQMYTERWMTARDELEPGRYS